MWCSSDCAVHTHWRALMLSTCLLPLILCVCELPHSQLVCSAHVASQSLACVLFAISMLLLYLLCSCLACLLSTLSLWWSVQQHFPNFHTRAFTCTRTESASEALEQWSAAEWQATKRTNVNVKTYKLVCACVRVQHSRIYSSRCDSLCLLCLHENAFVRWLEVLLLVLHHSPLG